MKLPVSIFGLVMLASLSANASAVVLRCDQLDNFTKQVTKAGSVVLMGDGGALSIDGYAITNDADGFWVVEQDGKPTSTPLNLSVKSFTIGNGYFGVSYANCIAP